MSIFSWIRQASSQESSNISSNQDEAFLKTCKSVKSQREKYGISLEMLSRKTRITKLVLESIENGLIENLPERTYLKKMLTIIELELGLSKDSLKSILERSINPNRKNPTDTFSAVNINVFSSWEGNLLYLILMFVSLIFINRYQIYLIKTNTLDSRPINNEEVLINGGKSLVEKNNIQ
tara:strand:- start:30 stop:566 length:537 start_codon:yes stop_codon:yes gene_type:complete